MLNIYRVAYIQVKVLFKTCSLWSCGTSLSRGTMTFVLNEGANKRAEALPETLTCSPIVAFLPPISLLPSSVLARRSNVMTMSLL